MPKRAQIPPSALVLGWLGVIPFAAFALAAVLPSAVPAGVALPAVIVDAPAQRALISYGAIILSFMGGAQWGLAMAAGEPAPRAMGLRLAISVMPALWAFGLLFTAPVVALAGLAAGFLALLAYDVSAARAGVGPSWYPALRVQLTLAAVACLIAAAVGGTA